MSRINAAGCCLVTLLTVLGMGAQAADAEPGGGTNLTVDATIESGSCNVSVSPARPSFPMIQPDDLKGGGIHGLTPVTVHLEDCRGGGPVGERPALHITGDTLGTLNLTTAPEGGWLFGSADSQVKGVGFVLRDDNGTQWDTAHLIKPGYQALGTDNTPLPGGGEDVSYQVGVGCGEAATCAAAMANEANTGRVRALITFTFEYH